MTPALWSLKPIKGQRLTSSSRTLLQALTLLAIYCCLVGGRLPGLPASFCFLPSIVTVTFLLLRPSADQSSYKHSDFGWSRYLALSK